MFENFINIFKRTKKRELLKSSSKDTAKERLHLVLMQDRANVSVDFLDLMRREIIEVIKKYIDIDEDAMDVRLTTETNEDGVKGVPALYANIPIINIKDETRKLSKTNKDEKPPKPENKEDDSNIELEKDEEKKENSSNPPENIKKEDESTKKTDSENSENTEKEENTTTKNNDNKTEKKEVKEEKKNEE